MESSFLKEDQPSPSFSASIGIEQDKTNIGSSVTKSIGYLPAVEKKLEASSKLTSDFLLASTANTPSNTCETAMRHGQEICFQPAPEICGAVFETKSTYGAANIMEETRKTMEQVGAQKVF
jgi:hypothetical protein